MSKHQVLIFNSEINKHAHDVLVGWTIQVLQEDCRELTILMNSSGGNVASGIAIMNFIRALPIEVRIHNTSTIGSIAIPIYCSADRRTASPLSTFTFHGSGQTTTDRLDEKTLREMLDGTKANNAMIAKAINEKSKLEQGAAEDLLRGEITKSSSWAFENGLCDEVCDFVIPEDGTVIKTLF